MKMQAKNKVIRLVVNSLIVDIRVVVKDFDDYMYHDYTFLLKHWQIHFGNSLHQTIYLVL